MEDSSALIRAGRSESTGRGTAQGKGLYLRNRLVNQALKKKQRLGRRVWWRGESWEARSSSRGGGTWREQGTAPRLKRGEREHASPGSTSRARSRRALRDLPASSSSPLIRLCSPVLRPQHFPPGQSPWPAFSTSPHLPRSTKAANLTALSDRLSQLENGPPRSSHSARIQGLHFWVSVCFLLCLS